MQGMIQANGFIVDMWYDTLGIKSLNAKQSF